MRCVQKFAHLLSPVTTLVRGRSEQDAEQIWHAQRRLAALDALQVLQSIQRGQRDCGYVLAAG